MLFLNQYDLKQCLDLDALRARMNEALQSVSLKQATNFTRAVYETQQRHPAPLGFMPAVDHGRHLLGYKAITVFHDNRKINQNPHQGIVVLLDSQTGIVQCILDGFFLTAVRTAAVSAVATDLLARSDSTVLALIGAGCQAIEHVESIARIRPIEQIHVYTRSQQSFDDFFAHFSHASYKIEFKATPQEAVEAADIMVTCTPSRDYLLSIDDIPKGAHINAIGACRPGDREIKLHNREFLKIYLDSEASCLLESDEIIQPLHASTLSRQFIVGEIGACLNRDVSGREHQDEITVFKSVGLSIEDVYAADYFYQKALAMRVGQSVIL